MQSSLKKSLYLGLAAVSFVAAAGATTANASAKAATVKSDVTMTTAATSRNVTLTGTNAVYTKPGTVKGAKVVATTTTAKKLAASKNGSANFRAYRVAVTDRGSVYYKVVSFDGSYRGYVYGGKSTSDFAGGLTAYNTTKDATAPKSTDSYSLNTDTSTTANTLFYAQPAYAQYKVGRATVNGSVLKATDKYKGATFTFDKAATTSREGETWYEIASTKLSDGTATNDLNGAWVKAANVKNNDALNPDTEVAVTVKDVANGTEVTSFNYPTGVTGNGTAATSSLQADNGAFTDKFNTAVTNALTGKGYKVTGTDAVNKLSDVKNGGSVTLYAVKNGQNTSNVKAYASFDGTIGNNKSLKAVTTTTATDAKAAQGEVIAPENGTTTLFAGTDGTSFTADQALAFLNGSSYYKSLKSPVFPDTDANGNKVNAQYVLTPASAKAGTFGTPFEAQYNVTKVTVANPTAPSVTPDAGNPFA